MTSLLTQTNSAQCRQRTLPCNNCYQLPLSDHSVAQCRSSTSPVAAAHSVSVSGSWRSSGRRHSVTVSGSVPGWPVSYRWGRSLLRRRWSCTVDVHRRPPRSAAAGCRWPVVQPRRQSADPARRTSSRSSARHCTATDLSTCRCSRGRQWFLAGTQSAQGRRHRAHQSSSRAAAALRRPTGTSAGTAGTPPHRRTRSWRSKTSRDDWSRRTNETRNRALVQHQRN